MDLFECVRLRATISERQCNINRKGYRAKGMNIPAITTCQGCAGLGESAQITLPVQEEVLKKKKITCGRSGCGYGVKKEGDFCKKHQEPITIPADEQKRGLDDGPPLPRQHASELSAEDLNANEQAVSHVAEELNEITSESFEPVAEPAQPAAVEIEHPVTAIPVTEQNQEVIFPPLEGEGAEPPKLTGLAALLRTPPPTERARWPADPLHSRGSRRADRERRHRRQYSSVGAHGPGRGTAAGGGVR